MLLEILYGRYMEVKVWNRSLLFVWSTNELLQSAVNLDVRLYLRLPKPFCGFYFCEVDVVHGSQM